MLPACGTASPDGWLGSPSGERGIRTLGTLAGTPDFESGTFGHSDISPRRTMSAEGRSVNERSGTFSTAFAQRQEPLGRLRTGPDPEDSRGHAAVSAWAGARAAWLSERARADAGGSGRRARDTGDTGGTRACRGQHSGRRVTARACASRAGTRSHRRARATGTGADTRTGRSAGSCAAPAAGRRASRRRTRGLRAIRPLAACTLAAHSRG